MTKNLRQLHAVRPIQLDRFLTRDREGGADGRQPLGRNAATGEPGVHHAALDADGARELRLGDVVGGEQVVEHVGVLTVKTTAPPGGCQHREDTLMGYVSAVVTPLRQQLADGLRALREAKGVSLEQVARRAGLSRQGVHSLETARTGEQLDRLDAIADALGADLRVSVARRDAGLSVEEVVSLLAALDPADVVQIAELIRAWPGVSEDSRDVVQHIVARARASLRAAG